MASYCQWDCHCWDCATDRRNSIRMALLVSCAIAVAGGLFVAYEASSAFDLDDQEGAPGAEIVAVS